MPIGFAASPADNDPHPPIGTAVWRYSAAGGAWLPVAGADETPVVTDLPTTGTIDLDLDALHGAIVVISLTGNPTFTTSNRAAGREVQLVLVAGGSARTPTFPGWTPFGAALPASIGSGKTSSIALRCRGTTDASIDAAAVESV